MRYLSLLYFLLISVCLHSQSDKLNLLIDQYHQTQEEQSTKNKSAWPSLSSSDLQQQLKEYKKFNEALEQVDKSELNQQELINLELLILIIEDKIDHIVFGADRFPLSAEGGFIISMIYNIKGKRLNSPSAITEYAALLDDTPRYIDQQIQLMKQGLNEDKVMPKLIAKNCLSLLTKVLDDNLEFLRAPLENPKVSAKERANLNSKVDATVKPSLERLQQFLTTEYIPQTRAAVGIGLNTEGKSYYEQRVRYYTTLDMTPEEVFNLGNQEVARIKAEMLDIIKELEYPGSFSDFIEYLRTDPKFYAETPQELLNHAAWLSMKAQEILPRYFTTLPSLPFTVNPVPEDIAPTYTTGRYSGGSFAGRKAGEYWVNTYNLPARPMYVLPSLTLHEAVPGHHLQISLAKELDLPKFRKNQYLSAFGEGWGLYAEYLGKEAGIYTTPYQDFGRLTYEMWRACRLVVDPGLHYYGWTREEAIQFMAENTSLSLHEVNTEIDRYIGWPGQAVSYKIGELKIRELRKRAEEKLGEKFDIREFHDLLLSNGSVPLSSLERIIDSYIDENK